MGRGKFDSGQLDKAIHNLEHLAGRRTGTWPRQRDALSATSYDRAQFRAAGAVGKALPCIACVGSCSGGLADRDRTRLTPER